MERRANFDVGPILPELRSKRVLLRWLTEADVPALFTIFGNAEVTRYWSHPPFQDHSDAAALLADIHAHFRERSLFQWGAVVAGELVGTCTLAKLNAQHRRAELGYALGRAHWGHGYMSEVLPVLLQFAFEVMDLHRIAADVDPRNTPSIRVLERLGFQQEGYFREHYLLFGELQDAVLYGLLRAESPWPDRTNQHCRDERTG